MFLHSEVTLVMKRLVKREPINVEFELPDGNRDFEILAGSNLRGEMIRLGVPVGPWRAFVAFRGVLVAVPGSRPIGIER